MSQPDQAQKILDDYHRKRDLQTYKSRRFAQLVGLPVFALIFPVLTYFSFQFGYAWHAILIAAAGIYILVKIRSLLLMEQKEYLEATKPKPSSLKKSLWSFFIFIAFWVVLSFTTKPL